MPSFSVEKYNSLLSINDAHGTLVEQLKSTNKSLQDLITDPEMTRLFVSGAHAFQFGICVLHRHHKLEQGERMVSSVCHRDSAMITEPSTDTSTDIYADRWLPDGSEFEHTFTDFSLSIPSPPDAFFQEFRQICGKYNVDTLGICLAELPLGVTPNSGLIVLEEPDDDDDDDDGKESKIGHRRQRTTVVSKKDVEGCDLRQSAWVPVPPPLVGRLGMINANNAEADETQMLSTLSCLHNCTGHDSPCYSSRTHSRREHRIRPRF